MSDGLRLWMAVKYNNHAAIQEILATPLILDDLHIIHEGCGILHIAAENGNFDVCQELIHRNINVRLLSDIRDTALHRAAGHGYNAICQLLFNSGAIIHSLDINNMSPLHYAIMDGYRTTVELLISFGSDLRGSFVLNYAAMKGRYDICEILLQHSCNVNSTDANKITALHQAVLKGHVDICTLLVRHGSQIDIVTTGGFSPIYCTLNNPYSTKKLYYCAAVMVIAFIQQQHRDNLLIGDSILYACEEELKRHVHQLSYYEIEKIIGYICILELQHVMQYNIPSVILQRCPPKFKEIVYAFLKCSCVEPSEVHDGQLMVRSSPIAKLVRDMIELVVVQMAVQYIEVLRIYDEA